MELRLDSRKVQEGDVFFCLKGVETDGHKFAEAARKNGAKVIIHQDELSVKGDGAVYIKVDDTLKALNEACDSFYGHPSHKMTVFGVTGTNGKSTITNIIRQIYSIKEPCGYIGTISMKLGDKVKAPDLTTPDAITLHRALKEMYEGGARAAALEVSSHGLSRGRVDSVDFDFAIFTNLTHDHLDYHKTMENYFEAKKLLFRNLKPSGVAIINNDDFTAEGLRECCKSKVLSYGIKNPSDYKAEELQLTEHGVHFNLVFEGKTYPVKTNLAAEYNIYNLLAAIAAMHQAGMDLQTIIDNVQFIDQIPGRMERIEEGQNFKVIVDYAHTPDGHEKIYQYAKAITPKGSRIIVVFGAAGKRDHSKRKVFGQLASQYADELFITSQDVRNENVEEIASEIRKGISGDLKETFIKERKEAIEAAVADAGKDDCVLILGKGDEAFMYGINGREPWEGDNNAAREAVKMLCQKKCDKV